MINDLFTFLKDQLLKEAPPSNGMEEDTAVNFVDLNTDPPSFKAKINILLVNIEEEKLLRAPDPYTQINSNGDLQKVQPPYRLNLYILFAAKPIGTGGDYNYLDTMMSLSKILSFFQANPVFMSDRYADLGSIDKLVMELHSLSYSQQNEIWSSLKTAYLPSVCYKAKMLIIQKESTTVDTEIENIELTTTLK